MKTIVLLFVLFYSYTIYAVDAVPIVVGGDENMDACSSLAMVNNLKADLVDDHFAVRSGPSTKHAIIDKLKMRTPLWVCREKDGWLGVVYQGTSVIDCGVSSTIYPERPYKGPCHSGWVREAGIEIVAG